MSVLPRDSAGLSGRDNSAALFDVASKRQLQRWGRTHKLNKSDGKESGQEVIGLKFDDDGELQIVLGDGTSAPAEEPERRSPWEQD